MLLLCRVNVYEEVLPFVIYSGNTCTHAITPWGSTAVLRFNRSQAKATGRGVRSEGVKSPPWLVRLGLVIEGEAKVRSTKGG